MNIETERLVIREFDLSMAENVYKESLDEDNRRFVPDEVFKSVEEASERIKYLKDSYDNDNKAQVYPVLLKDGTYIGYVQAVPMDSGKWEIGYHIGEKYRKQGYATEAVSAFLPIIMKKFGITEISGFCHEDNIASIRVLEKCGFTLLSKESEKNKLEYVYYLSPKEIVVKFFEDGYTNKNYEYVMTCLADDYFDHSPACARSNRDAVGILRIVADQFSDLKVTVLDVFAEGGMVAARVLFDGIHSGTCMDIPATGRHITFEALEHFKVEKGKITESWGYWPDKEIEQKLS